MAARKHNHPAFTYAMLVSFAGGAGYVTKRHLPSLVGGTLLGIGFLGAGMLSLTDQLSKHAFDHGTSTVMASIMTGVAGNYARTTRTRAPVVLAATTALTAGYHVNRLLNPPHRHRYIPGSNPLLCVHSV